MKPIDHKTAGRRINLRLTPTDRLTIDRIRECVPSTMSDAVRLAVHTVFSIIQCARANRFPAVLRNDELQWADRGLRLVLRNDALRRQEDVDLTTFRSKSSLSIEGRSGVDDVLQIRLTPRALEELDLLVDAGFGASKTAVVRRALEFHHRILSKTANGARLGLLTESGEFTHLPILDLVYPSSIETPILTDIRFSDGNLTHRSIAQPQDTGSNSTTCQPLIPNVDAPETMERYEVLYPSTSNEQASRHEVSLDTAPKDLRSVSKVDIARRSREVQLRSAVKILQTTGKPVLLVLERLVPRDRVVEIAARAFKDARSLSHETGFRRALLCRAIELAMECQLCDEFRASGSSMIEDALQKLGFRERIALLLSPESGWSVDDVAAALNVDSITAEAFRREAVVRACRLMRHLGSDAFP